MADEELAPKTMLYPRDPSLDPQLVWKGKDEQDREDLPSLWCRSTSRRRFTRRRSSTRCRASRQPGDDQPNLFADFNGGPPTSTQKVDFYHHEQNWTNRLILGDSLLVMTSLAEKEGLKGKVQTIYIDPPYGIKFGSNWQVSTRKRDVKDGKAEDATRQPEQVRAFRDTWKLGIHSYLAYLRDRLVVARDLLTETGSVFVQIGDENVHLVRSVLDEVFGSENFVAQIAFRKTAGQRRDLLSGTCDYILWYAKAKSTCKFSSNLHGQDYRASSDRPLRPAGVTDGTRRPIDAEERADSQYYLMDARLYQASATTSIVRARRRRSSWFAV